MKERERERGTNSNINLENLEKKTIKKKSKC
jgi:hypothetical protein